jgi:photosystem II stability/assembly factor-like uncharacterized protein
MKRFILLLSIAVSIIGCKEKTITIDFNSVATDDLLYPNFDLHQSSWIKLDSLHRLSYSDIHFYNEDVGILSGFAGLVFITKDGAKTWQKIDTRKDMTFHCIYALNESTFLAARHGLFKSTDGGSTWKTCKFPVENTVFDIWFKDSNTGFLSSAWGTYRTVDEGETWTKVSNVRSEDLQFTSENIGYFCCGSTSISDFGPGPDFSTGTIFRTLDCGKTWTDMEINVTEITSLSFISDKTGFFTTYDGGFYKTTDGGKSCIKLETNLTSPMDIFFINEQQGYLCTLKGLFSTTDGGNSFTKEYFVESDNNVFKFVFPTPNIGYSFNRNGFILKRVQN